MAGFPEPGTLMPFNVLASRWNDLIDGDRN
jgi:hypothetical protein